MTLTIADTLVIDRVLSGTFLNRSTDIAQYRIDNITNPSLKCTTTSEQVKDAMDVTIMELDRSKDASFSAECTQISLALMASQFGSTIERASEASKILLPWTEVIPVGGTSDTPNTTITLAKTPAGTAGAEIGAIFVMGGDRSSLGTKYTQAVTASTTAFSLANKVITLPTSAGITNTDQIYVRYYYESSTGVKLSNSVENFPDEGAFDLEVLMKDKCTLTSYYGHMIFPKIKIDGNVTIDFKATATHAFGFTAFPDYCDINKQSFYLALDE